MPPPPKYWVLRYEYVADILERRGPYREAHLRGAQAKASLAGAAGGGGRCFFKAWASHLPASPTHTTLQLATGQLVCAGATGTPPDGGLFLFKDISQEDVEAFVTVRKGERCATPMGTRPRGIARTLAAWPSAAVRSFQQPPYTAHAVCTGGRSPDLGCGAHHFLQKKSSHRRTPTSRTA